MNLRKNLINQTCVDQQIFSGRWAFDPVILSKGKQANEPPESRTSPLPMDIRKPRVGALPASCEGKGYLMEGDRVDEREELGWYFCILTLELARLERKDCRANLKLVGTEREEKRMISSDRVKDRGNENESKSKKEIEKKKKNLNWEKVKERNW
ncbi:hypothetical protein EVAR_6018_1 [Eumeta japonica]|uniref:Uncharacterized protein n=1 Tax=Eumeta variegata TaxID=151549 RepID=A0A4C1T9K2_EUMVA|nr:hypothetical protein EVAR_6018_1 [Eumeta japonica]